MESCYKNIFKIRNVIISFENFEKKKSKSLKKNQRIYIYSEKLTNLFYEHLFIGQFYFYEFVNYFSSLLLCKINILDIFKGQHQCNSIDFWSFFWVEGKVVRKNALRIYLSFQGNFVIDKYLKMAALELFSCSVFFCSTH